MTAETEAAKNIQEIIARNARYRMQERKDRQVEAEMLAMCNAHRAQVSTWIQDWNRQEAEAAELLIALLNDPQRAQRIRANAHRTAIEQFLTLEKRFGMEAQLVIDTAQGKDTSHYPEII